MSASLCCINLAVLGLNTSKINARPAMYVQLNIQVSSCSYFCRGKGIGVACSECVSLAFRLISESIKIKTFRTVILLVVLCAYETWSLTLREEHWLKMFENRVLGKIFGPKTEEVTGQWRKLHTEDLNDMYCSPNVIRVIK